MTVFTMTYQPVVLDAPTTTYWDLAQFNVALQQGVLQSGRMVFQCYTSEANIGNGAKVLDQKSYDLTAAEITAFQQANNLQPGQIAAFAYGLAQTIKDVVTTPAILDQDGNVTTPAVMASFFQSATLGN